MDGPFARFAMTKRRSVSDREPETPSSPTKTRRVDGERAPPARTTEDEEVVLDGPQRAAFEAATRDLDAGGGGVLVTGAGGCGKSATLRAIRDWAAREGVAIGVTSSTGRSADLVGGCTVHSFLGVGVARDTTERLARKLVRARPGSREAATAERMRALRLLVVDEVSMLSAEFIDKASGVLSAVRGDARPFGGVRVAFFGDFCQLPPVEGGMAFEAAEWKRLGPEVAELRRSYRQDGDANARFREILGRVRLGTATDGDVAALAATAKNAFPEGVEPTRLFATNAEVDRENAKRFGELRAGGAACATFARRLSGDCGSEADERLAREARVPESVELCDGAQVVVTFNVDQAARVFNGARAVVVSVGPPDGSGPVRVRLASNGAEVDVAATTVERVDDGADDGDGDGDDWERPKRRVTFVPLRLAWATTVHGAQGETLDCLEVDLERTFVDNQAYTALSRGTSLERMRVLNARRDLLRCDKRVLEFYRRSRIATLKKWLKNV